MGHVPIQGLGKAQVRPRNLVSNETGSALRSFVLGAAFGRRGSTEEMADAILFLASDMSTFMTGHALVIDGGECI
ncbi:Enoyl-(Acyl carrier protein) reductase [Shimia gijangensis]|uniref:Enoyl-(Acyl carrier protein) reductase n=2 Tax=Shimia gijangensis TaxID=1470563 RepID=A0A1M6Q2U9_9RHOB|nr:Enoyl-(Acyl carrier protein) reductase [Shimia gijangensis]